MRHTISRIPVIRLGKPSTDEIDSYTPVQVDGITVWYETKQIMPDTPDQPICISVKKMLFNHLLQIDGARQFLKTS